MILNTYTYIDYQYCKKGNLFYFPAASICRKGLPLAGWSQLSAGFEPCEALFLRNIENKHLTIIIKKTGGQT